jgi:hypothetical protein
MPLENIQFLIGEAHPDDASMVVIREVWRQLRGAGEPN